MKSKVVSELRAIFHFSDELAAAELLRQFLVCYKKNAPELATWAANNVIEGLTVMRLPQRHRLLFRITNMLERQNKTIWRSTRAATLFPNTESCLRLISAVLVEVSEGWETGRHSVTM